MWILWLAMAWFVLTRLGGRRRWSGRGRFGHHGRQGDYGPHWSWQQTPQAAPVRLLSAGERRERELTELRRRYVADELSVEQYEAELDRVLASSPLK